MPDFSYIARERTGSRVSGVIAAGSKQEALSLLAGRTLFPLKVEPAAEKQSLFPQLKSRVRPSHLATFYAQLADLLKAGVPLLRSLELLQRKSTNAALGKVLKEIHAEVADGTKLSDAMRQHSNVFGDLGVSMVRAGEEGSFLEDVLKRIAAFTEHQQSLKSRVQGALIYPLFLIGMLTAVVIGMLVFFVPKFAPIFERMSAKGELPIPTQILMAFSDTVNSYWPLIVIGIGIAIYFGLRAMRDPRQLERIDGFKLRAYGIGPIVKSLAISRFCRILGTLLNNGVPILRSLQIAKDATGNRVLTKAIGDASESVSAGKSLAGPLGSSGEFPDEVIEMIAVGEEANNLEEVLVGIAETTERNTNRQLDIFVRMLEPLLLTVMAGIVLFVVAALLLPILQSSGAF
ncbi:type II secretion system F family protein [Stratiformator vulcanicus]|uniref:Type II secretion system protein F n=1 Tax=Stratiformator vulcanicus TaxID=2527980 RepID=A0A517R275_9PLAN|nr:type II secretion system F family protein [Stratiformator vulcanicus]QDT37943.1 Putative type II secretion system protein F [Stratiformator vulcanicus]